jgi:hypothetical protein
MIAVRNFKAHKHTHTQTRILCTILYTNWNPFFICKYTLLTATCVATFGGFYLFPRFLREHLPAHIVNDVQLVEALLKEGVAVLPGTFNSFKIEFAIYFHFRFYYTLIHSFIIRILMWVGSVFGAPEDENGMQIRLSYVVRYPLRKYNWKVRQRKFHSSSFFSSEFQWRTCIERVQKRWIQRRRRARRRFRYNGGSLCMQHFRPSNATLRAS